MKCPNCQAKGYEEIFSKFGNNYRCKACGCEFAITVGEAPNFITGVKVYVDSYEMCTQCGTNPHDDRGEYCGIDCELDAEFPLGHCDACDASRERILDEIDEGVSV